MLLRYFITDSTNIGTLITGKMFPETMLLLLGKICLEKSNKDEIILFFVQEFKFSVIATNITFAKLNIDDNYPYTYYNLIDEHVADKDGYLYANIEDIQNYFCNSDSMAMLKSIDLSDFKKKYFLYH